jgi:putative transposase
MTKLTNKKMRWLVNRVVKHGDLPKDVSWAQKVSDRRVQQLVKQYLESGLMPVLKKERRPKTSLTDQQKQVIEEVYGETRRGARLLYYEIQKRRKMTVSKNKIHAYLVEKGYTLPNPRKQGKRKRCRYERQHTGSLLHGDWHRTTENSPHAILWLDDASRKLVSGGEYETADTPNTLTTFYQAEKHLKEHNIQLREVNTDRGTQFYNNREGTSRFENHLQEHGINYIPSRRNNPQTNGKLERHWQEYDRHRSRFPTLRDFINWYNNLISGALNLDFLETPNEAFLRKMPQEAIFGLAAQYFGW